MDVQNAVEPDQTRPAGASSPLPPSGPELDVKARPPASLTAPSPPREPRPPAGDGVDNAAVDAPSAARPDDLPPVTDRDSDAETIVLPGKDGHSPSKARKVRHEDRSDSDGEPAKTRPKSDDTDGKAAPASASAVAPGYQLADNAGKKRVAHPGDKPCRPRAKEGLSSGLSSAPESPPPTRREQQHQNHQQQQSYQQYCRRPSDTARSFPSDAEPQSHQKTASTKSSSLRDKTRSAERMVAHKRKAPNTESDDEADMRKARRQRTSSANPDGPRPPKDVKSTPARPPSDSRARSISPQPRQHRRSISSLLPSQSNGTGAQRKRLPPPLQPTDYHSDDSSVSGSPHPRSSKLRSLATQATADSTMSPAKMAPHKKHLDAHGQTLLARACARGEYDTAKLRLAERPEDLNVADYAGNTPLQIASLHGCEDIVELLIDAGCNLDCVNYDKDTPLLDAVDNGHMGVVRLLLDAGVNPRKANVNGQEPLDRVSDETNNADEIRAALVAARKRAGERRRTSEDRHSHPDHQDVRDSHAPESPRRSPPAPASTSTGRRSGTVRSTKTRNDLLYMPLDDKTLRQAAGRGDKETVARILQVKEAFDDPESMVAAARGGHDLVIQLLLGLGGANPDPGPVPSLSSDFATPILAAIGQENIKVIELLLEQQGFDPTRRFKGDTYYEIARRRQGTNWKEEEQMLKNAYDDYRRAHKDNSKVKSPQGPRERERDREDKAPKQDEIRDPSKAHKHTHESPPHDEDVRKRRPAGSKTGSPREKRSHPLLTRGKDEAQTRVPGRVKKDPPHTSDREVSPVLPPRPFKSMRAESDLAGLSSEGETAKPRRKLVSKGELSKERDRKRTTQEPASPREPKNEDATDKTKASDKHHNRTKVLKRDERDHPSADIAIKRQRMSTTPDRPSDADKDLLEGSTKRRRLDADVQSAKRPNRPSSIDERNRKSASSRPRPTKAVAAGSRKEREGGAKEGPDHRKPSQYGPSRSNSNAGDKSIYVKSEDVDVLMHDLGPHGEPDKPDPPATEQVEGESLRKMEPVEEEADGEDERRRVDAEEKKRKHEEDEFRRKREEEEKARRAEEERKKCEEEARKRRELADRERREAEEAARRQAEEKKRMEEEKRRMQEEQKRRDEEERLRREQLAREAAEEARRQREEEERKERERRDRAHREEVERKRAAREAEQKRMREEQERARLDKLPPLLRWLDLCPNPKTSAIAEKFKRMVGARYDTIRQEANGTPAGREQWVLNTHVALLLGEKDLDLSRYTAWEREPASRLAKLTIWRTEWACYALLSDKVWDLGRQLPNYYGVADPSEMGHDTRQRLKEAAWDRFLTMDMFFVKVSDLLYTVPNIPHLRNVKLAVEYRELLETEAQLARWQSSCKWKQDPGVERFFGFSPRYTYYVNGAFAGEEIPTRSETSKTPFPEVRVPRRGLVRAYPTDSDYDRLCIEQGLQHLLQGPQAPAMLNGVHSSPPSQNTPPVNGASGSASHDGTDGEATTNGVTLADVSSL